MSNIVDTGEIHIAGIRTGGEIHVRLPSTTRTAVAIVLGTVNLDGGMISIYLDRLVHTAAHRTIGSYRLSGGLTTILTGPPPARHP